VSLRTNRQEKKRRMRSDSSFIKSSLLICLREKKGEGEGLLMSMPTGTRKRKTKMALSSRYSFFGGFDGEGRRGGDKGRAGGCNGSVGGWGRGGNGKWRGSGGEGRGSGTGKRSGERGGEGKGKKSMTVFLLLPGGGGEKRKGQRPTIVAKAPLQVNDRELGGGDFGGKKLTPNKPSPTKGGGGGGSEFRCVTEIDFNLDDVEGGKEKGEEKKAFFMIEEEKKRGGALEIAS